MIPLWVFLVVVSLSIIAGFAFGWSERGWHEEDKRFRRNLRLVSEELLRQLAADAGWPPASPPGPPSPYVEFWGKEESAVDRLIRETGGRP